MVHFAPLNAPYVRREAMRRLLCAFAHAILRCGAGKGDSATINVRLTVGLERRDADWVVMHEHHSVAVGM